MNTLLVFLPECPGLAAILSNSNNGNPVIIIKIVCYFLSITLLLVTCIPILFPVTFSSYFFLLLFSYIYLQHSKVTIHNPCVHNNCCHCNVYLKWDFFTFRDFVHFSNCGIFPCESFYVGIMSCWVFVQWDYIPDTWEGVTYLFFFVTCNGGVFMYSYISLMGASSRPIVVRKMDFQLRGRTFLRTGYRTTQIHKL